MKERFRNLKIDETLNILMVFTGYINYNRFFKCSIVKNKFCKFQIHLRINNECNYHYTLFFNIFGHF